MRRRYVHTRPSLLAIVLLVVAVLALVLPIGLPGTPPHHVFLQVGPHRKIRVTTHSDHLVDYAKTALYLAAILAVVGTVVTHANQVERVDDLADDGSSPTAALEHPHTTAGNTLKHERFRGLSPT